MILLYPIIGIALVLCGLALVSTQSYRESLVRKKGAAYADNHIRQFRKNALLALAALIVCILIIVLRP